MSVLRTYTSPLCLVFLNLGDFLNPSKIILVWRPRHRTYYDTRDMIIKVLGRRKIHERDGNVGLRAKIVALLFDTRCRESAAENERQRINRQALVRVRHSLNLRFCQFPPPRVGFEFQSYLLSVLKIAKEKLKQSFILISYRTKWSTFQFQDQ